MKKVCGPRRQAGATAALTRERAGAGGASSASALGLAGASWATGRGANVSARLVAAPAGGAGCGRRVRRGDGSVGRAAVARQRTVLGSWVGVSGASAAPLPPVTMLDREGGWSVSFAGCGFLGVYHIGAATCLQERAPHVIRDARRIYGASAGALAGAVLVGGGSMAQACADVLELAKEARKRNLGPLHPSFNVIKIIRDGLMRNLPENTHQLSSGRLCISLTRVSDGKNALISNFNSKEEVVQALICSSFVPIYCGLIPPSFRGVRYVDGGISDNLPQYESKNTITVSPFAGECDICPKGNSANFHEMNVTNTSIQFSLGNLYRLTQALFPPEPKVLGEICEQGYSDALKFLKENGILNDSIYIHLSFTKRSPHEAAEHIDHTKKKVLTENSGVETLKMEALSDQLKQNPWPLEKSIFESLPPRLRKALQEACKEQNGFYAQFSKLFPMRVISYLMLPYTLPVESAYSIALRLVNWFPDMPADIRWMQEQLCQIAATVYSQAKSKLFCISRKLNLVDGIF